MRKFAGVSERICRRLEALGYWRGKSPDVMRFCEERGYRPQYVYAWLKNRIPSPEYLGRLARDLGVSEPWILFGDGSTQAVATATAEAVTADGAAAAPARSWSAARSAEQSGGVPGRAAHRPVSPAAPRPFAEPSPQVQIIDFKRLREVTDQLGLLQAQLDGIFQAFPDRYFWLDADGTILDCMGGREAELPRPVDALLGRPLQQVFPADAGPTLHDALEEALRTGALVPCEFSLRGGDRQRAFEARLVPLDGKIPQHRKVLLIVREITERKQAEEATRALVDLGRLLTETVDLERILGLVVEKAVELLQAQAGCLFLIERVGEQLLLDCQQSRGMPREFWQGLRLAEGEGITGRAVRERRPVWTADILGDPDFCVSDALRRRDQEYGVPLAMLGAPLLSGDAVIGGIVVYRPTGSTFAPHEVQLIAALASQGAVAITNARLHEAERRRAADFACLVRAARALATSPDLDRVLEIAVQAAVDLTGAAVATVRLVEEGWLVRRAAAGPLQREVEREAESERLPLGRSILLPVLTRGEFVWIPDLASDPRDSLAAFNTRHSLRWFLGVPILAASGVLGTLSIKGTHPPTLTTELRELLDSLAAMAAAAIQRLHLTA